MSWFSRLRNHVRGNALSTEIDKEMQFHLAERADDLVAGGMKPDAAQREARRRFGSLAYQTERTRARDLFSWLDALTADLRYATRSLKSAPAFAVVAILSLALGIGANTAIFSIINAVMLKSLPVSHPEELVAVVRNTNENVYTNPLWEAIRDRQDMFSGIFAFGSANFNLTSGGEARRADGNWVSGDYFSALGVRPIAGRLITRADDYRGCPGVAVLSNGFWQQQYSGDANAIGKTLPNVKTSVQATKASVENLNLLQAGRGEIAFTLGDSLSDASERGHCIHVGNSVFRPASANDPCELGGCVLLRHVVDVDHRRLQAAMAE